jgi:hypothetical protein
VVLCIVLSKCVCSMLLGDRGFATGFGDRYLMQNMDWLQEELGGFDDDYLVFDCPGEISFISFTIVFYSHVDVGQIELYTHHPFLPNLVRNLTQMGIRTSAVYLVESQFMEDRYKFFGCVLYSVITCS